MVFLKLVHTQSQVNHKMQPDKEPKLNIPAEKTEKICGRNVYPTRDHPFQMIHDTYTLKYGKIWNSCRITSIL